MKPLRLVLAAALAAQASIGCYSVETPGVTSASLGQPGSFRVEVKSLRGNGGGELPVVQSCAARYGSDAQVPPAVRGTQECRYAIPRGGLVAQLGITALNRANEPMPLFNGPVSFRVVPGQLSGDYATRWAQLTDGQGTGWVVASRVYGEVRIWVGDEPPQVDYANGEVAGDTSKLPQEPAVRSYATGLSPPIFFEEPTLARVQEPDNPTDNRGSPFSRQFLTIGRAPETGTPLAQNCPPLPSRAPDPADGQLMTLVVTGTDNSGFFVTDLTACRVPELNLGGSYLPEPGGVLPGSYGSIYLYNYSFPENLYPGDLLWTLSGSVQEFTGTTQLTFPAWTVREHVRRLPQAQWGKYLDQVTPTEVSLRLCGSSNEPRSVEQLCGYYYDNMKMESLESALVKLRNVRFPEVFTNCNLNGDEQVPFFCSRGGTWTSCFDGESANDIAERQCNIDCTTGTGQFAGRVCAERHSFNAFGQFPVELAGPGPREALLDDSVPGRIEALDVKAGPRASSTYVAGAQLRLWCDTPVRVRFGPRGTVATSEDSPLPAHTLLERTLSGTEAVVALLADGAVEGSGTCQVAMNPRVRINVVTRDAVTELVVDCREDDPDAERARQCRNLRGATYDVVGHLRQVTAARPRWVVLPRDSGDFCCRPGPGLECPRPIQPCPATP